MLIPDGIRDIIAVHRTQRALSQPEDGSSGASSSESYSIAEIGQTLKECDDCGRVIPCDEHTRVLFGE